MPVWVQVTWNLTSVWLSVSLLKSGCFPLAHLRGRVLCIGKSAVILWEVLQVTLAVRWVVASPADKRISAEGALQRLQLL